MLVSLYRLLLNAMAIHFSFYAHTNKGMWERDENLIRRGECCAVQLHFSIGQQQSNAWFSASGTHSISSLCFSLHFSLKLNMYYTRSFRKCLVTILSCYILPSISQLTPPQENIYMYLHMLNITQHNFEQIIVKSKKEKTHSTNRN